MEKLLSFLDTLDGLSETASASKDLYNPLIPIDTPDIMTGRRIK
ncbi:hypothetical protein JOD20_004595 [Herpetosiphon giganteus]|nr:hypothetical protein [Herpetosiphon giganteus]